MAGLVIFLLAIVGTQHSQHEGLTHAPATVPPSSRTFPTPDAFPAGLSLECVGDDGAKTTIALERMPQGASSAGGSCRFFQRVRDEMDRREAVTTRYETSLRSDFLAAPASLPGCCSPSLDRGLIAFRGRRADAQDLGGVLSRTTG